MDPIINQLMEKMVVTENKQYSIEYLDPNKRSIANALQVHFTDGTVTDRVAIEYPLGHRFRREEAIPKIVEKFSANLAEHYSEKQRNEIERSEEHTSELQSRGHLVCRLLLEKKK